MDLYKRMSDSELVAALKSGDMRAFDAVFMRWYPQVNKFLRSIIKEKALAEDLSQMVFMKLWLGRDQLDPSKSFKNYLFVLARNGALDVLRLKKCILMEDISVPVEVPAADNADTLAEYDEVNSRILQIMNNMPPQRSFVFNLSRFQNMSNKEISEMLGVSVRTVEKHIELALRDLRKHLS